MSDKDAAGSLLSKMVKRSIISDLSNLKKLLEVASVLEQAKAREPLVAHR